MPIPTVKFYSAEKRVPMLKYDFPKAELHLHLDGSIKPETMWRMAKEKNIPLPTETLEEFRKWIEITADCRDVAQYLERFALPCSLLQDAESLAAVTEELIGTLAEMNYCYAEIRFAPQKHTDVGMTQRDAVEAVLEGRRRGLEKNPNIRIGIILCGMSIGPETVNMDENLETVRVAKEYLGKGVVGCDLAGAEGIVPLTNFRPFSDACLAAGIPLTMHAGENAGPQPVREVMSLGTQRIGHGHRIWEDPELCREALEKGITFEICPTSNIQCRTEPSYPEHPAKKMLDYGLKVCINNDNMVLAATNIEKEYDHCIEEMGFTIRDLVQMNINAVSAAFLLPDEEKQEMIRKLESYL